MTARRVESATTSIVPSALFAVLDGFLQTHLEVTSEAD